MRSVFVIISFLFLISSLRAQEIMVLSRESHAPLLNVTIFNLNKSKSVLTNFDGRADISKFGMNEILIFNHLSHLEYKTTKDEIQSKNNRVYLEPDKNLLQEVVLSVAKFAQKKQDIPQRILSISSENIRFSNAQTAADLLENSGQVYVQKSQLGGGSPMIRGFSTNRLLITMDGVRMNTAIFRSGNLQNVISIDPFALEHAEVILGPGSVVYGSDAVGGVMNFYTLKPRFSMKEETSFSGNAVTRYATANNEKTVHADLNIGRRNWSFLSSITYSDFGDLMMGSHGPKEYLRQEYSVRKYGEDVIIDNPDPKVQVPTGYNQINLLQKIAYMADDNWVFNLGIYFSTTSNFPRYDRLYQKRDGQFHSAEWYYGPQTWFSGNFKIDKSGNGKVYDKAQFTGAYQYFEESRNNRDFGKELLYSSEENVDAYSVNFDFEKDLDKNKLFYGLEYVLNNVFSEANQTDIVYNSSLPDASRYPDGSSWQSFAAYLSFKWHMNPELVLQTGARYNHIFLKADFDNSLFDFPFENADLSTGALTGTTGLSWQPAKSITWKINLSTAFRAPNIDDVGKIFDSEPGSVVVPNPDLKPEYAYNAEAGVNWKITESIGIDLASFYTHLDDALVRRDFDLNGVSTIEYQGEPSNVQAIQNAAKAYVYGFEGGIELKFTTNLAMTSHLTLTKGKEEQDDGSTAPLRHAAPLFGNAHLVWKDKKLTIDLFGEYNGQFDFEDLAPSEQGKAYLYAIDQKGNPYSPSWYTINLSGQYAINDNLQATASFENISDQGYRTYSSGISAAGRNLILAVNYSF